MQTVLPSSQHARGLPGSRFALFFKILTHCILLFGVFSACWGHGQHMSHALLLRGAGKGYFPLPSVKSLFSQFPPSTFLILSSAVTKEKMIQSMDKPSEWPTSFFLSSCLPEPGKGKEVSAVQENVTNTHCPQSSQL